MSCAFNYEGAVRTIGPTWRKNAFGIWDMPEYTLGPQVIAWIEANLLNAGKPFELTAEQRRFLMWWYAVDTDGAFVYRGGVLQRIKGWGKDPLVAVIAAVEFLGPCRFGGWQVEPVTEEKTRETGLAQWGPKGVENPDAWIVVVAVSESQTGNTMGLFPGLFTEDCKKAHGMRADSIGKTVVYAHGGQRKIVAVTSNPRTLEGNRPSFTIMNETHHWIEANGGHDMLRVLEDNATKGAAGASRTLAITNAYASNEDSVAQKMREAWELSNSGAAIDTGLLYDSLELAQSTPLIPEDLPEAPEDREAVIREHLRRLIDLVRGDAVWLNIPRIVNRILDGTNTPSKARRFWFNSITAAEDAWLKNPAIEAAEDDLMRDARRAAGVDVLRAGWAMIDPDDPIVMAGDMSKNDDDTGLIGCRLSDGFIFVIGHWGRPAGVEADHWQVSRDAVDARVDEAFERFNIVGFIVDPSHTEDEDASSFWRGTIDAWHTRYQHRLQYKAIKSGDNSHAILWDMQSPRHQEQFAAAAEQFREELQTEGEEAGTFDAPFRHDGHPMLKRHMRHAREYPTRFGISLWKGGQNSKKKIDLAVCAVMARMLRRFVLISGLDEPDTKGKQPGAYWGA